jgi:hypothetical protein
MANVYRLKELHVNDEASFAVNAESLSSNTFGTRLPALRCDLILDQERIRDMGYRSRMNEESLSNPGIRSCSLEFETYLPAHHSTTAGSLTANWCYTLLKDGLGGGSSAATGTTVSSATTAASYTWTATTGAAAGMIYRIGNKTEARGHGQAIVVSSVGPPTTSLVDLDGTPTNGDVVYAMLQAHHDESVSATLTTKRFRGGWASSPVAGQQFQILGTQLAGFKMTFPMGDNTLPRMTWRYQGAYWGRSTATIPSSDTLGEQFTAPVAAGSLFLQDVGTSTRNLETPAELELDVDLGLAPIVGPGGAGTYQNIVGWQRTRCQPTVTMKIPWESTYETWFDTANQSLTAKHLLFLANPVDGRSFAFYMPNVIPIGNRPSLPSEVNEQNYVTLTLLGREGTTTTTELTRSAIRFALG